MELARAGVASASLSGSDLGGRPRRGMRPALSGNGAIATPGAWWIGLLSFLPPLAPILMPARLALGTVAAWAMPVAVLIMVVAVYGMVRLAARIYAPALVHGGARLSWSAALRLQEH